MAPPAVGGYWIRRSRESLTKRGHKPRDSSFKCSPSMTACRSCGSMGSFHQVTAGQPSRVRSSATPRANTRPTRIESNLPSVDAARLFATSRPRRTGTQRARWRRTKRAGCGSVRRSAFRESWGERRKCRFPVLRVLGIPPRCLGRFSFGLASSLMGAARYRLAFEFGGVVRSDPT